MNVRVPHFALLVPVATRRPSSSRLRMLLVAGCTACVLGAGWMPDPVAELAADPAFGRLLRGMAAIKGVGATAAIGALLWRFGKPIAPAVAAGYLGAIFVMVTATVLVWQLAWLLASAVAFHVGLVGMLLVAWTDGAASWPHRVRSARARADATASQVGR